MTELYTVGDFLTYNDIMITGDMGIFFSIADNSTDFPNFPIPSDELSSYYPIYDFDLWSKCSDKPISSVFDKLAINANITPSSSSSDRQDLFYFLAMFAYKRFNNKWVRLYSALVTQNYTAINNYEMTETMAKNGTATETEKDVIDQTETEVINEQTAVNNSTYGFNSASSVPVDAGTQTHSTNGTGNTRNIKTNGVDGNVKTKTSEQKPYILTRSGNIGVTTTQQMIQSEVELRQLNNWLEIVYDDFISILTTQIYY